MKTFSFKNATQDTIQICKHTFTQSAEKNKSVKCILKLNFPFLYFHFLSPCKSLGKWTRGQAKGLRKAEVAGNLQP